MLRPLHLFLTYSIIMMHFCVIIFPFCWLCYIFLSYASKLNNTEIISAMWNFAIISLFFVSSFICIYIFFDFIFGFTAKNMTKGMKKISDYDEYSDINEIFNMLKDKYNRNDVILYIDNSEELNSYAIGSFKRSFVILTKGFIKFLNEIKGDGEEYLNCIGGILGHEMSHIVNMDFLPGIFLYTSEYAMKILSDFLYYSVLCLTFWLEFIPFIGRLVKFFLKNFYKFLNWIFDVIFYRKIILPIDFLIRMSLSRWVEYRSDRDSARAFGNEGISGVLGILEGSNSIWKSIFSTHPRIKNRIKKVQNIEMIEGKVMPNIISDFSNAWCILMIFFCTFFLGYKGNISRIPYYTKEGYKLGNEKFIEVREKITKSVETAKGVYVFYKKIKGAFG